MDKKIIIGSMLVLTLLLLMPSIPAIQLNTIKDKVYSDYSGELNQQDVEELKELLASIEEKLANTQSRDEVIDAFNELIQSTNNDVLLTPGWAAILFILEIIFLFIINPILIIIQLIREGELLTTIIELFTFMIFLLYIKYDNPIYF